MTEKNKLKSIIFLCQIFLFLLFAFSLGSWANDDDIYLKPGKYVNSDHPDIIRKAAKLTKGSTTDIEKAKALFEYVRDSHNQNQCESYKASDILKCGGNLCYQRAVLLAALCRAAGIPGRLRLQIVTMKEWEKTEF